MFESYKEEMRKVKSTENVLDNFKHSLLLWKKIFSLKNYSLVLIFFYLKIFFEEN